MIRLGALSTLSPSFRMASEGIDDQINTVEDVVIDGADEEVIETVLNSALGVFTWDDIMRFSSVCWSWRLVVRGQLTSRPLLFDIFKRKYPDEEVCPNPSLCPLFVP